jgi:basic membrane lipoprotein Med (substrate-binding protein (PBP1-ABC) superfamily)
MEDLTGRRLGPYQITAALGAGGMGAVYKAYQPAVERYVALKVLPRDLAGDPQFVARFRREATIIAGLQHPHILPVHDFGEAEGHTYIVMPCVTGGTLKAWLKGRPLPLGPICDAITQVGMALDYAHARGVVHRDVKPGNVLLDETGNCLLADFGLAKMVEGTATLTNAVLGTPAYMSPEQGLGEKLDGRSDIYSLGVILYEMATGRPPYGAETPMALVLQHINGPLPPASSVNPALGGAVEGVIQRALARHPRDRYATAGEFVDAVRAATRGVAPQTRAALVSSGDLTVTRPAAPPARARSWMLAGLVGLVAAVSLFVAFGRRPLAVRSPPPALPARAAPAGAVPGTPKKVCFVSMFQPRPGSIDAATWSGIQGGVAQYGGEASQVVATRPGDTGPDTHLIEQDLRSFVGAGCDLIAATGFAAADAMAAIAKGNPRQRFLLLDFAHDPPIDNVTAYVYATDEGAFLAGYVAAAVSRTGKVGTFGGFQFPTVESYMDGFALGVGHYNERNGTRHKVLGWDVAKRDGYFTNDFAATEAGARMGDRLLSEGADVILPVAGSAGLGAADPVRRHGRAYLVGVDTDWAESYPETAPIVLTSVEKRFNLSALVAIKALAEGKWSGGTHVGTIANGEIGLAPYHHLEALVSDEVRNRLGQVKTGIMTGRIKTRP